MPRKKLKFPKYSLRSRLLVLSGATFLMCAGVILMFFPLLNLTLEGLLDSSVKQMREAKEVEATTIARLMVLEFSRMKELLEVKPGPDSEADHRIKDLLWQKVTFNEVVEGIELIRGQGDGKGSHLTYLFYRREALELKPMAGPQKLIKKFSGNEKELLDFINTRQMVDKRALEAINWGPKEEGQMLLRYLPIHILVPEEGALYWGVAKIGIDTSGLTHLLTLQNREKDRIRKAIWVELILSLTVAGVLVVSLLYLWARSLTEPLRILSLAARDFKSAQPREFGLWLENLRRVDSRGQAEVDDLKETLMRLGGALPRLGERLFAGEYQACLARVAARALPVLMGDGSRPRQVKGGVGESQAVDHPGPPPEKGAPGTTAAAGGQDLGDTCSRGENDLREWLRFAQSTGGEWRKTEVQALLAGAWRLVTVGLPPTVRAELDLSPTPPIWGAPGLLAQAFLLVLEYAAQVVPPEGRLQLKAGTAADGVTILLKVEGAELTPEECGRLLAPLEAPQEFRVPLGPALAAAIAAAHDGELTVTPDPQGVTLTLRLPPLGHNHELHEPYI
jgi:signal transduction histidine kinase